MMRTLKDLQRTTDGLLQGETADGTQRLGRVVTDSRQVEPGRVFWALAGPRHDGADFAQEAFQRGAAGVVASRPVVTPPDRWSLVVEDSPKAIWLWAAEVRRQFTGTVIAVTGSVGQSTTRQMIHTVLGTRLGGTAGSPSGNNLVGVPLGILRIEPEHDYAVLELGADGEGRIAEALKHYQPVPVTCEVTEVRGATIINDAPNANPMAMEAALELLRDFDAPGRRIMVCGDLNELG